MFGFRSAASARIEGADARNRGVGSRGVRPLDSEEAEGSGLLSFRAWSPRVPVGARVARKGVARSERDRDANSTTANPARAWRPRPLPVA